MQTIYLSLGSNIGDRQYYIHEAIRLLGEHPKIIVEQQSQFYETSPVGGVKQDDFINIALKISSLLAPQALLDFIHEVEQKLNRERKIHWGPRTIDIDILFYGEEEIIEQNIVIPHRELLNRLFVMLPLLELIEPPFKYYQLIQEAVTKLNQSEQHVQVVAEDPTPRGRIASAVKEILFAVGEDPHREGLLETPQRVAKMYEEILSSQRSLKFKAYKLFKIEPTEVDSPVLIKDIPFYSMCEHHMLPFFGKVHVAYIPDQGNIIGLSKIPRLVDYVSHKLSVQENITSEIAETLNEILQPKGVAVVVEARHMCVEMRGVKKLNSKTKTSYFSGAYEKDSVKRMEFLESLL